MSEYYTDAELKEAIDKLCVTVVDLSDHVSKSELRKWCEENMPSMTSDYSYEQGRHDVCHMILENFCKEREL